MKSFPRTLFIFYNEVSRRDQILNVPLLTIVGCRKDESRNLSHRMILSEFGFFLNLSFFFAAVFKGFVIYFI